MGKVILLDTSVFGTYLGIFGNTEKQIQTEKQIRDYIEDNATLLLPMATILETGNHIATIHKEHFDRQSRAQTFVDRVREALSEQRNQAVAFRSIGPTNCALSNRKKLLNYIEEYLEYVMTEHRVGLADLSIIQDFRTQCALNRGRYVAIWSFDGGLKGYKREPEI
jgi:hypothetical protein